MARGAESSRREDNPSRRIAADLADEARLGMLLERTYAEREARVALPEDALAKMDALLDRAAPVSRGRAVHSRASGARVLAALLVLLVLGSVGLSGLAIAEHTTTPSVTPPVTAAVNQPANVATAGQAGETSETPLRDLLERAGIHVVSPPGSPSTERRPPSN